MFLRLSKARYSTGNSIPLRLNIIAVFLMMTVADSGNSSASTAVWMRDLDHKEEGLSVICDLYYSLRQCPLGGIYCLLYQ